MPSANANAGSVYPGFCRHVNATYASGGFTIWFVLSILRVRSLPKIANSVVRPVAVYMVNLVFRPLSVNVKPRQSMLISRTPVNAYGSIPKRFVVMTSAASFWWTPFAAGFPYEDSTVLVIGKDFLKTVCGKMRRSHDAPVKRIGQRPGGIASAVSASPF